MMDFASNLFLESPIRLGVFSFLLFAVVLLARQRWEGSLRRYSLPAALATIALLFITQKAVTTAREQLYRSLDEFIAAIERGHVDAWQGALSEGYDCDGLTRAEAVAHVGELLARVRIYDTILGRRDAVIKGDRATMRLFARATVSIDGAVGEFHQGSWVLEWRRAPEGWRITAIRPRSVDGVRVTRLSDLHL